MILSTLLYGCGLVVTALVAHLLASRRAVTLEVQLAAERTKAQTLEQQLAASLAEAAQIKEESTHIKYQAEKKIELVQQQLATMQQRMEDWEKTKVESLKAAKEAMFSTGGELFRKEAEELGKKTMEGLQGVLQSVASLNDRVGRSENTVTTLWRSLSNPAAVGSFSEFGLENTFKHYGLEAGRDFVTQYSVSGDAYGSRLRPDAVVFLPADHVLVVDSKASKFFLELAEVEGTDKEQEMLENLKRTMHEHLKSLASKGYKEAVLDYNKQANHDRPIRHIITVMYVQSETSIEKILKADPDFRNRAEREGVVLSGPTGLAGLMSLVRYEISRTQQQENQEHIVAELSQLLGSIETVIGHALKVGKGIESAAQHYNKFSASMNRNVLAKARKITRLGVALPKNKALPGNLPSYLVHAETGLIEGQAEEVFEPELEEITEA